MVGAFRPHHRSFSETMPVTALPASNTPRWWLDYTVNGDTHSLQMRLPTGGTDADAEAVFSDLLALMDTNAFYLWNILGMRSAAVGTDVSLPATYGGPTAAGSGSSTDGDFRAHTYSLTGRDAAGHKIKVTLFGAKLQANGDYRIQNGENASTDVLIDYFAALDMKFVTINALQPIWNNYVNTGWNDHWIKSRR